MVLMTLGSHKSTFLAMNSQRSDGTLCDVKLKVEGGQVLAHKAVLAACCPYFNTMFNGGFMEGGSSMTEVNMSKVFPDLGTAERIIESMYTDQLDVTPDNVCTLYSVCSFLLFNGPIQICEDFMTKHLSMETCLEYWQATHYHNMSGELHSSITVLLKNRFHDRIIYQDCLLDIPVSSVSSLLKARITKFCSPKQIVDFLVDWSLKSTVTTETRILKRLLLDADLPPIYNLPLMLDGIHETLTMKGIAPQTIQDVCYDLQAAVGVTDSGKSVNVEKDEQTVEDFDKHRENLDCILSRPVNEQKEDLVVKCGNKEEKKICQKDREAETAKMLREPTRKTKAGNDECTDKPPQVQMKSEHAKLQSDKQRERPVSKIMGKNLKPQGKNPTRHTPCADSDTPLRPDVISKRGAKGDWMNNTMASHVFTDLFENTGNIDAVLALAPWFTGVQGNNNEYKQLRLLAYLLQPGLWVELGTTEYPRHDNGEAIIVSKSHLFAVGGNVYLLSGVQLYYLCLSSTEWKKVVMPDKDYSDRRIYPLCQKGSIFLIIIDFAALEEGAIYNKVLVWKVTGERVCEEVLEHKEDFEARDDRSLYGPCWVSESCFLVNRTFNDGFGIGDVMKGDVLLLDPENKDIKCVSYECAPGQIVGDGLGERPFLLECDDWFYFWEGPTVCPSSSGELLQGCQMSEDNSKVLFQRKCVEFPEILSCKRKGAYIRSLAPESPSSPMITTDGSRLWCLSDSGTSKPESSLHEFCLQSPDDLKELAPPPCNVILAVTTARLDSAFLSKKSLARYHHIEDPISESQKKIPSDADPYEDYDDFDVDYDDYGDEYDVDYDDYDVDYDDYDVDYDDYDVWDPQDDANGDQ